MMMIDLLARQRDEARRWARKMKQERDEAIAAHTEYSRCLCASNQASLEELLTEARWQERERCARLVENTLFRGSLDGIDSEYWIDQKWVRAYLATAIRNLDNLDV